MAERAFNLAIETSSRCGSVAVGRGDDLLATRDLPAQRRHALALLPTVDALAGEHGFAPADLGEVYVSIGPGSFTGLRVAVTTAKMLARAVGSRLVAVPTLEVVAQNAPADCDRVAVMLSAKGGRCFTGVFDRRGEAMIGQGAAQLLAPGQLLDTVAGEVAIIGDHLPEFDWPGRVTLLDAELARPRGQVVWHLGRARAAAGGFADPYQLTPMYVRLPEPEEKLRAANAERSAQG